MHTTLAQQAPDCIGTDTITAPFQLSTQLPQGLARPFHAAHRITGRVILQQLI